MNDPCYASTGEGYVLGRNQLLNALSLVYSEAEALEPDDIVHTPQGRCSATEWGAALAVGLDALCHPEPCMDEHLLGEYVDANLRLVLAAANDPDHVFVAEATVFVLESLLMSRIGHHLRLQHILAASDGCECDECIPGCADCLTP